MAGLIPATHVLFCGMKDANARDKYRADGPKEGSVR